MAGTQNNAESTVSSRGRWGWLVVLTLAGIATAGVWRAALRSRARGEEGTAAAPTSGASTRDESTGNESALPSTRRTPSSAGFRLVPPPARMEVEPAPGAVGDAAVVGVPVTREVQLREIVEHDPGDVASLAELTALLSDRGREAEAGELVDRCLRAAPTNATCARIRARADMREGNYEHAAESVAACLRIDPNAGECVSMLATMRIRGGSLDEAEALVARVATLAPDSGMAELSAATLAVARRDSAAARVHFQAACARGEVWACAQIEQTAPSGGEPSAPR